MAGSLSLVGVNLAGGEFDPAGSNYGSNYLYPTDAEIDYEVAKGMNVIRLPFLWERLQPALGQAFDAIQIERLDDIVDYATARGLKVVLDPHDYGKYNGQAIGSSAVPNSEFASFWGQLAGHYAGNPNVMFGLMNEPDVASASGWLTSVNAAIAAIRTNGANQEVLVPGIGFDGAWTWTTAYSDNANVIGTGVEDASNNYAFEVHQYLDSDGSGTGTDVASATTGADRLAAITNWAEQNGKSLFLGEFGAGSDPTSIAALGNMLSYMTQHKDVWQGGTYWAAGPLWGSYMFSAEPSNGVDKPQMVVLEQYGHAASSLPQPAGPTPTSPPTSPTVGSGAERLVLGISEDAFQGDAQYTVAVDGQQVGGTLTARSSHAAGQDDLLTVLGNWGAGAHSVSLNFLNDAYGGSASTDRNLYVDSATIDGVAVPNSALQLYSSGAQSFSFQDTAAMPTPTPTPPSTPRSPTVGSGADTLVLGISEDAFQGDAQYTVSIDGEQVGGTLTAQSSHAAGQDDLVTVLGDWAAGAHAVSVDFLNDAYGGGAGADRNVYVDSATTGGIAVPNSALQLYGSGAQSFSFHET